MSTEREILEQQTELCRSFDADREAVHVFAGAMLVKLRKNANKPHWYTASAGYLFARAVEEMGELAEALTNGATPAEIESECCDVANFLMMLAERVKAGRE